MINIYAYIGDIYADIEESIERQKNNFKLKYDKSNIIYFDFSENFNDSELKIQLKNAYENLPLFSTKKLIILKDVSALSKEKNDILDLLLDYLQYSNEDFITIIQDTRIDRRSKFFRRIQKLEKDGKLKINKAYFEDDNNIEKWVIKTIQSYGFNITKNALSKILEIFNIKKNYRGEYVGGFDTIKIKNQLLKLFDYKKDDKLIKEEDVNNIDLNYENPNDSDIYELVNLIFQKDKRALKLFEKNFYNTTNEKLKLDELVFFNTIMINQIEDMIIVSDMIVNKFSDADISNKLNWDNVKRIYPIKLKLKNFKKQDLFKFYKELGEIDILSKTNQDISLYKLNLLIIEMING
ncbi:MAG TPA: hypothetical protein PK507_00050 [bacterium]|nr:hypothetical protein [bacterium]